MEYSIIQNKKYGYKEIMPKPSAAQLEKYYKEKYYQQEKATYSKIYTNDEVIYFKNKIQQKFQVIQKINPEAQSILDVGCGEGFALEFFHDKEWQIKGLDYSSFGILQHHPHLSPFVETGDIYRLIEKEHEKGAKYDTILLDNVLEHSIDPENLLQFLGQLANEKTVMVIEVPNDYTLLQNFITQKEEMENYWEAFPDHLVYFNKSSLRKLLEAYGWKVNYILGDFPIEWFLFNENSNYVKEKTKGKAAHQARILIENLIHSTSSPESLVSYYSAIAEIGQGRQIIGYFTLK